jgi:NAD(P)-dependent dehydrogenase (short-subunit alcohol dehydrogenase family)
MSKPVCAVVGVGPKNGASFARRFASEGYRIALMARSTEYSRELAATLPDARVYACDVGNAEAVASAFAAVRSELGEVEVLVYNAGSGVWGTVEDVSAEGFEQSWRVNALDLFFTSKEVIPAMKAAGRGHIVVVGATASLRGKPHTAAFAAAKAAQRSLAQSMARQLGPAGIHVSLLIIDGAIARDGSASDEAVAKQLLPDAIAESAYMITRQNRSAWSFEIDLRPNGEPW